MGLTDKFGLFAMNESKNIPGRHDFILELVADIVAAYAGNNTVSPEKLPDLINEVYGTLVKLSDLQHLPQAQDQRPAVPIKKSITGDFIICLEDGKKLKMLKRYLRTRFNLSPDDYRQKWGLPVDYPMVAPSYARKRSELAKKIGLGKGKKSAR